MKIKLVQNPIIHIVLFGFFLALVLLISFGIPINETENRRIVISNDDVQQLLSAWQRTWQRQPTQKELRALLQNFVREEVLYREALNRNYDRDDIVIKRSLVRKMDFLAEGQVQAKDITDDEIKAYYNLRQERYRIPPMISFAHIYYNLDQRGEFTENAVLEELDRLKSTSPDNLDLADYGDRFMLNNRFAKQTPREIKSQFGEDFANELITLDTGIWQGPVASGYGLHAVYIESRIASRIPEFEEVKNQIINDIYLEEKAAARDQFYTEILRQYEVVFEDLPEEIMSGDVVE